jgi:hypothetical protein
LAEELARLQGHQEKDRASTEDTKAVSGPYLTSLSGRVRI